MSVTAGDLVCKSMHMICLLLQLDKTYTGAQTMGAETVSSFLFSF